MGSDETTASGSEHSQVAGNHEWDRQGETEARYRAFFENSPLGILLMDAADGIAAANPAACHMLGRNEQELRRGQIVGNATGFRDGNDFHPNLWSPTR
jgi:PAS domain-containing protein